ncbi:ArnT family glycosyltransferase [Ochrovirga pacifica]|uniref:ArnT family glycosyltransferase n=1 Tax=Ochrovirga pacifica TaxID=1042376 RepID=UPI000255A4E2|nr:glycosyltransferase family 39 protein [Ochrovirga pacifica]
MLNKVDVWGLYFLLIMVYGAGLFIPLMENDSAQHATMAMRMYVENDFWNIYKGTSDYLDKPQVHFWLAALSFKLFGLHDWAYRIPALLFTIIGAFSANKLAVYFYGNRAKHIAALVFLSAQAVILSNHDVRTDAVLTGATMLAICYFVMYLDSGKWSALLLGFLGTAIGFGTKGQLAVFVCGVVLLVHVIYQRKWKHVFSYKLLVGLMAYAIFISPVLYAYYIQFDLHPEKVIKGQTHVSGVKFILWDQSFNRLNATGHKANNQDYLFFFHTLLWAFLPWAVLVYYGFFVQIKNAIQYRFKKNKGFELISSLGVLLVLLVISTSKFKLPHYLNSLFPLMAVLVAGQLVRLEKKERLALYWKRFQVGLMLVLIALVFFVSFWTFPLDNLVLVLGILVLFLVAVFLFFKAEIKNSVRTLLVCSVAGMAIINFVMNTQFYPNLLQYQSGIPASKIIKEHKVPAHNLYLQEGQWCWSLNFYAGNILPTLAVDRVADKLQPGQWMYVNEKGYKQLKAAGVSWSKIYPLDHYRITMLKLKFLNPKTRSEKLSKRYLIVK